MNYRLLNLIIGILVILPLTLTAQTFNRKFTKHDIDIGSADNTYDVAVEDINNDGYIDIRDILLTIENIMGVTPQQQSAIMNEVKRLLRPGTQQTRIGPNIRGR